MFNNFLFLPPHFNWQKNWRKLGNWIPPKHNLSHGREQNLQRGIYKLISYLASYQRYQMLLIINTIIEQINHTNDFGSQLFCTPLFSLLEFILSWYWYFIFYLTFSITRYKVLSLHGMHVYGTLALCCWFGYTNTV